MFRPLPGLTIATLVALSLLMGLGTWQLQRRAEKHALLDQIHARELLPAAPVELLLPVGSYGAFRKATAEGTFLNDQEVYVAHARLDDGPTRPGFRVLTPFELSSGGIIFVDRGWVASTLKDPATRKAGQVLGRTAIRGALQPSGKTSWFTPPPDVARRVFYVKETASMAHAFGLVLRSSLVFELAEGPKGGPEVMPSRVEIPDNHLNYALTWYSLAIVLLVVYLRYHHSIGRLKLQP